MHVFTHLAKQASRFTGRPLCFALALLVIVAWAVTGPLFGFSDTWQLVINTGTTVITFLMVFLIQNTQNRLMDLEEREEGELDRLREQYEGIAKRSRRRDPDDGESNR